MSTGFDHEKHQGHPDDAQSVEPPLVVRASRARRLLGIGSARLYQLIHAGELESFLLGRNRLITLNSIARFVDSRLAASRDETGRLRLYRPTPAAPPANAGSAKAQRGRRRTNSEPSGV